MRLQCCVATLGVWAAIAGALPAPFQTRPTVSPVAASPEAYIGKGYQYLEHRRYAEAAQEFQTALSLNPHLIQVRYQLAICEFALGHLKEARSELNQVEKETPGNPEITYYLGRLDLREGDYQQAIQELLKICYSPPFPDTTYYLGSAYLNKGMLSEAEKWLLLAAKANPRDFRVADHLARLYQGRRGHHRPKKNMRAPCVCANIMRTVQNSPSLATTRWIRNLLIKRVLSANGFLILWIRINSSFSE